MAHSMYKWSIRFATAAAGIVFITGCVLPGVFWRNTDYFGPVVNGVTKAQIVKLCEDRSPIFPTTVSCEFAFEDHRGNRILTETEIRAPIDEFIKKVEILQYWQIEMIAGIRPYASAKGEIPFQLHLLTISPLVVLVSPKEKDIEKQCQRVLDRNVYLNHGCIQSNVLQYPGYIYGPGPKSLEGAFWFSPTLGVTNGKIQRTSAGDVIYLPDSELRLIMNQSTAYETHRIFKTR